MQKVYRLTNNASFNYIHKKGKKLNSKFLVIAFVDAYNTKIGISVSKKIGNSVVRSLVKRRIKENFRALIPILVGKKNYVVIAKEGIAEASFLQIGDAILDLLKKAKHLKLINEDIV